MPYPMIAVTTDGTTFACAGVSLTETGLAVLNENGSRTGFVPYTSLEYVAPTAEAAVSDPSMTVLTADGSEFGAASISQASAGVAVLDRSGARIGFVPYDTLTYVLPEAKTGSSLPADAEPADGVALGGGTDEDEEEGESVWGDDEDEDQQGDGDQTGEGGVEDGETGDDGGDGPVWGDEPAEEPESDPEPDPDTDVIEEDLDGDEDTSSNDSDRDIIEEDNEGPDTDPDDTENTGSDGESGSGGSDGESGSGGSDGESGSGGSDEREEAEESELVVEWSFGEE